MSSSCECYVLSGGGVGDGLITRTEESDWCGVSECNREVSIIRGPMPSMSVETGK
jgi:hypothetical protein